MGRQHTLEKFYIDHGITNDIHGKPYEFKYVTPPKAEVVVSSTITKTLPPSPPPPPLVRKFADDDQLIKIVDLVFYAENMKDIHGAAGDLSASCDSAALGSLKGLAKETSGLISTTTSVNKPGANRGTNYEGLSLPKPLKYHPTNTDAAQCATRVPSYFTPDRIDEYQDVGKAVYDKAVSIIHTVDSSLGVSDAVSEFCNHASTLVVGGGAHADGTHAYTELCSSFDLGALETWAS